jgi:signal peptidase
MKIPSSLARSFLGVIALAAVVVAWVLFAPMQIGGQAAYAIISGNSMEPGLHRGDLVVLQRASDYQVGDVATYRHPTLGPVIHRIVAEAEGRYVFKGDNNTWLDSYQPTPAELIGKFWIYAPSVGKIVEQLRRPWVVALVVAFGGLAMMVSVSADTARRSRGRSRRQAHISRKRVAVTQSLRTGQADLLFVVATLGVAALMLGLFAFTRPVTRTVFDDVKYQHAGNFTYSAVAPPGIYDGDTAKTGEPIFRRLISRVNVTFDYQLQADRPADLEGVSRLNAVLASNNGWRSVVELQGPAVFRGAAVRVQGTLDLQRIQALLDDVQQQTGVISAQYTLAIVPTIAISGTLSGQPLRDTFAPQVVFTLDELQLQLAVQQKTAGDGRDPLQPAESKSLRTPREVVNTIPFLGASLAVPPSRNVAVVGLICSLLGGGILWRALNNKPKGDDTAHIRARYDALLVSVRDSDLLGGRRLVAVTSIADLAKIAERSGRMILHQAQDDAQLYLVQEDDITYCYRPADSPVPTPVSGGEGGR